MTAPQEITIFATREEADGLAAVVRSWRGDGPLVMRRSDVWFLERIVRAIREQTLEKRWTIEGAGTAASSAGILLDRGVRAGVIGDRAALQKVADALNATESTP